MKLVGIKIILMGSVIPEASSFVARRAAKQRVSTNLISKVRFGKNIVTARRAKAMQTKPNKKINLTLTQLT